eukprot:g1935.t1
MDISEATSDVSEGARSFSSSEQMKTSENEPPKKKLKKTEEDTKISSPTPAAPALTVEEQKEAEKTMLKKMKIEKDVIEKAEKLIKGLGLKCDLVKLFALKDTYFNDEDVRRRRVEMGAIRDPNMAVKAVLFECKNPRCGNKNQDLFSTSFHEGNVYCTKCSTIVESSMLSNNFWGRSFDDAKERGKAQVEQHVKKSADAQFYSKNSNKNSGDHASGGKMRLVTLKKKVQEDDEKSRAGRTRNKYKDDKKYEAFKKMQEYIRLLDWEPSDERKVFWAAKVFFADLRDELETLHNADGVIAACMLKAHELALKEDEEANERHGAIVEELRCKGKWTWENVTTKEEMQSEIDRLRRDKSSDLESLQKISSSSWHRVFVEWADDLESALEAFYGLDREKKTLGTGVDESKVASMTTATTTSNVVVHDGAATSTPVTTATATTPTPPSHDSPAVAAASTSADTPAPDASAGVVTSTADVPKLCRILIKSVPYDVDISNFKTANGDDDKVKKKVNEVIAVFPLVPAAPAFAGSDSAVEANRSRHHFRLCLGDVVFAAKDGDCEQLTSRQFQCKVTVVCEDVRKDACVLKETRHSKAIVPVRRGSSSIGPSTVSAKWNERYIFSLDSQYRPRYVSVKLYELHSKREKRTNKRSKENWRLFAMTDSIKLNEREWTIESGADPIRLFGVKSCNETSSEKEAAMTAGLAMYYAKHNPEKRDAIEKQRKKFSDRKGWITKLSEKITLKYGESLEDFVTMDSDRQVGVLKVTPWQSTIRRTPGCGEAFPSRHQVRHHVCAMAQKYGQS